MENGENEANHTTPTTEPDCSVTLVRILERALSLDNHENCLFFGKDGEVRTECWKVQFHHFLVELLWKELDISRRDLLETSMNGAEAWAGGRAICDELEKRQSKNKATVTCGLVVSRHRP